MLKNFGYDGAYHDENISVSVLLENPAECGLDATELVFSVALRAENCNALAPLIDDFTFYVMDEAHHIYNTQTALYSQTDIETTSDDDEPIRQPNGFIHTHLEYDFLFQDLRIAFYYRPYRKIIIIILQH